MGTALASNLRDEIVAQLELLSSTDRQLRYAREVPTADVPAELVCCWFDDLNLPESLSISFSGRDLEVLLSFSNLFAATLAEVRGMSVSELLQHPCWLRVVGEAGSVLRQVKAAAV
jgi:hypothetical protein